MQNFISQKLNQESSLNFLQNTVVFVSTYMVHDRGLRFLQSLAPLSAVCGAQRLNIYFEKKREEFFSETVRVTLPTTRLRYMCSKAILR